MRHRVVGEIGVHQIEELFGSGAGGIARVETATDIVDHPLRHLAAQPAPVDGVGEGQAQGGVQAALDPSTSSGSRWVMITRASG